MLTSEENYSDFRFRVFNKRIVIKEGEEKGNCKSKRLISQ